MKNLLAILVAVITLLTISTDQLMATDITATTDICIAEEGDNRVDLIVQYIQKERVQRVHGGYNVFVKVVIKNQGYDTVKQPFNIGFRFSPSNTQSPYEALDYRIEVPYIGAKASVTNHACLFIPDNRLYGTNILSVQAKVDDSDASWSGKIYETNENNNKSNVAVCYLSAS